MLGTRKMIGRTACALMLLLSIPLAVASEEATKAIQDKSTGWIEAFNKGDARGVAAHYTEDAKVFPPNAETVSGRKAIEEFWAQFVQGVSGTLEIKEIHVSGDMAISVGRYEVLDEDMGLVDRGKYIEVWKRTNGDWGLHRDIFNTSLPAPGSE